jgi:hypothetical protein
MSIRASWRLPLSHYVVYLIATSLGWLDNNRVTNSYKLWNQSKE